MKTWASTPIVEKNKNVCKNEWIRIRQVIQKDLLAKSSKLYDYYPKYFLDRFLLRCYNLNGNVKGDGNLNLRGAKCL